MTQILLQLYIFQKQCIFILPNVRQCACCGRETFLLGQKFEAYNEQVQNKHNCGFYVQKCEVIDTFNFFSDGLFKEQYSEQPHT